MGPVEKILRENVASFTVLTITDLSYDGTSESKLQLNDAAWVKNDYDTTNTGGLGEQEMCHFQAITLKEPDPATLAIMERLKTLYTEDRSSLKWPEVQQRDKEIEQLKEQLRKQKIMVISYCSC